MQLKWQPLVIDRVDVDERLWLMKAQTVFQSYKFVSIVELIDSEINLKPAKSNAHSFLHGCGEKNLISLAKCHLVGVKKLK